MINALPRTPLEQAGSYTFLATREYFSHLISDIHAAKKGDRILLATMSLNPFTPTIRHVLDALKSAALRGVGVSLQIDAYSFMVDEQKHLGPLFYRKTLPYHVSGIFAELQVVIRQLQDAGVGIVITNPPKRRFMSPFAGRSHIKASIINNKIYLGGCNLNKLHLDAMVVWNDPATADWLYGLLKQRTKQPVNLRAWGRKDLRHAGDKTTTIILDVGVKRQSAIYREALDIIDRAQDWLVMTCQYFPNSTTAKHLKQAANRGVRVVPIFNHYSAHSPLHTHLQHAVTSRERLRMPKSFFEAELPAGQIFLHAKLLATEKEAIIGSHNYVPSGVTFGTAEIALHSQDPAFARASSRLILEETGLERAIVLA